MAAKLRKEQQIPFGNSIQLSPEGEVNSGGNIYRDASRRITTTIHRP